MCCNVLGGGTISGAAGATGGGVGVMFKCTDPFRPRVAMVRRPVLCLLVNAVVLHSLSGMAPGFSHVSPAFLWMAFRLYVSVRAPTTP